MGKEVNMKKFKVLWEERVEKSVWIEASSEKDAVEKHNEGEYSNDSVNEEWLGFDDSYVVDSKDIE
jgi:hypothetical protein